MSKDRIVRRLLLLALLLFPLQAYATPTEIVRYVDGNCAENGDGSASGCAKTGGGVGAHSNLCYAIEAERAIGVDLVSRDVNITVYLTPGPSPETCTNFSTALSNDQAAPYPGGGSPDAFTKDSTHHFTFIADPEDRYALEYSNTFGTGAFSVWKYINIETPAAPGIGLIASRGSTVDGSVIICTGVGDGGANATQGIQVAISTGTPESRIANNIIIGCDYGIRVNNIGDWGVDYDPRVGLYNNTVVDSPFYGIYVATCSSIPFPSCGYCSDTDTSKSALFLANNLIDGSGTADFGWGSSCNDMTCCFYSLGANATSDGTSPDGSNFQSQTASFVSPGTPNYDYHLTSADEACYQRAVDLRANDFYAVTNDFEGQPRAAASSCGGDGGPPIRKGFQLLLKGVTPGDMQP